MYVHKYTHTHKNSYKWLNDGWINKWTNGSLNGLEEAKNIVRIKEESKSERRRKEKKL
jgi:hypothetical protein